MSTSLMYHAFGLVGYDYIRQTYVSGSLIFHVQPKAKMLRCPSCKSKNVLRRGESERWLRTVPIGFKPVWLVVNVPRVECRKCGCVRRIDIKIADKRRWYTKAFERFVLFLVKTMTMLDAARRTHSMSFDLLHRLKSNGEIHGFIMPYLGQNDEKLPCPPSDLVKRDKTYDYPTDFDPMPEEMIRLISKRGEQLTRNLIETYYSGL